MSLHIGILTRNMFSMYGGCERTCVSLSSAMLARGHTVSIFAEQLPWEQHKFALDPRIRLVGINHNDAHSSIQATRDTFRRAGLDVALTLTSYKEQLFWAVSLMGTGIPYIYGERNDPEWIEQTWSRTGRLAAMSGADAIQIMLPEYVSSIPPFLRERVRVIPNAAPPVQDTATHERGSSPPFTLLSLGMFRPAKRLPLLIEAFEGLYPQFPDWNLHIWGGRRYKKYVRIISARVEASPARKAILLRGLADSPGEAFGTAHVFCIPSRYEGIPNTVLEAMACGAPVVGIADCTGVRSLVRHGINGLLAPERSAESLRAALVEIMRDEALRLKLGQGALESVRNYLPQRDEVFGLWEKLFYETAARKGKTRMDAFTEEPFASRARLSAAARREWIFRDFGRPFPGTFRYYREKVMRRVCIVLHTLRGLFPMR